MAARKKQLTLSEVKQLIRELLTQSPSPNSDEIMAFAEAINRGSFKEPNQAKPKALTATAMKKAVLNIFDCKTVSELRKNKTFLMAFAGGQSTSKDN